MSAVASMNPGAMTEEGARAAAWNAVMTAQPGELELGIGRAAIDGVIPPALFGSRHLQNGPGWTLIGGRLAHPFDGHGFVRAVTFTADGGARLQSRFVQTPAYAAERAVGRLVHRGLGTNPTDSMWRNLRAPGPRNVANTTIQPWAGRLLAGWEGGRPYALDHASLGTLGEETFGGALPDGPFLAHMRVDTAANRLVGCSLKMGMPTRFTFREFDAFGREVATREVAVPGMHFVHDFVVTPRWYVLPGNPLTADPMAFVKARLGKGTLIEAIAADVSQPGELYLVPRGRPGRVRTIRLPQRAFVVHFANAFDVDDATCAVDLCAFENFEFGHEFGFQGANAPLDPALPDMRAPQRLYRATIADDSDMAQWRRLAEHGIDFPRVHPALEGQDAPATYASTRGDRGKSDPFDAIIRVDNRDAERPPEVWQAGDGQFVGEPVFAPAPDAAHADDGHVLAIVYDGVRRESRLCVFAADAIARGPVASIPMPLQPYGFHGAWEAAP
jgi:carotenoid cleavage dioxygenase-like enzyme